MPYKYHYDIERNGTTEEELVHQIQKYLNENNDLLSIEMKSWAYKHIDEIPQIMVCWLEGTISYSQMIVNDHVCTNNRLVLLIRDFDFFREHFMYNNNYYDIIRYGLCDDDIKIRKMSMFLLEKTLLEIKDQTVEIEKFTFSPELQKDWELLTICLEAVMEQQTHLWLQIVPSVMQLWETHSSNPKMVKWIIAMLNRGLKNSSAVVRKSVATFILKSEIGTSLFSVDHRFLFQQFFAFLDESPIYTSQGVGHLYSEFGENFSLFIKELVIQEDPYLRFKELLAYSEHFNSHLALYFYLSGILLAIEACSGLQNEVVFMKLLKLLKTHYFSSRLILVKSIVAQSIHVIDASGVPISNDLCMSLVNIISQYSIKQEFPIWSKCSEIIRQLAKTCIKDAQYHYSHQTFKNFNTLSTILLCNKFEFVHELQQTLVDDVAYIKDKSGTHPSILLGLLKINKMLQEKAKIEILDGPTISWLLMKINKDDLTHLDRLMEYGNLLLDYQKFIEIKDEKIFEPISLTDTLIYLAKWSNDCKHVLNYSLISRQQELTSWLYKYKIKCAQKLITPNVHFTMNEMFELLDKQSVHSMHNCVEFIKDLILQKCILGDLFEIVNAVIAKSFEIIFVNNKNHKLLRQVIQLIHVIDLPDIQYLEIQSYLLSKCESTAYISEIILNELVSLPSTPSIILFILQFSIFGPNRTFDTIYAESLLTKISKLPSILQSDQNTRITAITYLKQHPSCISAYFKILQNDDFYPNKDFPNGHAFKVKTRSYAAILMISKNAPDLVPFFNDLMTLLGKEKAPQIRVWIEWILCFLAKDAIYLNQMILQLGYTTNIQLIISVTMVMIKLMTAGELTTNPVIERFLMFYCSNSHYATRVHVQYVISQLDTQNEALQLIKSSFNEGTFKNFDKCVNTNYMVGKLHYKRDMTMEMVFNLIPMLLKLDFTEIMGLATFKEIADCRDIVGYMTLNNDEKEQLQAWEQDGLFMQRKFVNKMHEFDFSRATQQMALTSKKRNPLIVVGSLIENSGNLAALCRTCEIFLIDKLVINSMDVLKDPGFKNVGVSSEKWMPMEAVAIDGLREYLKSLKCSGYTIIALEQSNNSEKLGKYDIPPKSVILMGNEKRGIPNWLLGAVDVCVEIPQYGFTKSLNVNSATSMLLFEYMRQNCIE